MQILSYGSVVVLILFCFCVCSATGNVVVQLAKHVFKASKVIAIAGSDDKCEWLKKIGADVAL